MSASTMPDIETIHDNGFLHMKDNIYLYISKFTSSPPKINLRVMYMRGKHFTEWCFGTLKQSKV